MFHPQPALQRQLQGDGKAGAGVLRRLLTAGMS